jgi:hypothetical protein
LGVALGAASLSALAFWVLGGRDQPATDGEPEEEAEPSRETVVAVEEPSQGP